MNLQNDDIEIYIKDYINMSLEPYRLHAVAFGIYISDILDIEDLFRLVAKEYSVSKDSKQSDESDESNEVSEELNEDTFWNIKLYDDVTCEEGNEFEIKADNFCFTEFTYVGNNNIKIRQNDCGAFMIYIGKRDTEQLITIDTDEKTLTDMFIWKRKLIEENRLPSQCSGELKLLGKRNYITGLDK